MLGVQIYNQTWTVADHHVMPWVHLTLPMINEPLKQDAGARTQMLDEIQVLVKSAEIRHVRISEQNATFQRDTLSP